MYPGTAGAALAYCLPPKEKQNTKQKTLKGPLCRSLGSEAEPSFCCLGADPTLGQSWVLAGLRPPCEAAPRDSLVPSTLGLNLAQPQSSTPCPSPSCEERQLAHLAVTGLGWGQEPASSFTPRDSVGGGLRPPLSGPLAGRAQGTCSRSLGPPHQQGPSYPHCPGDLHLPQTTANPYGRRRWGPRAGRGLGGGGELGCGLVYGFRGCGRTWPGA